MIRNDPSGARRMVQQMADAGNKRIARMLGDSKGRYSPIAQKAMEKEGPYFSVKGVKDQDTLYNKFQQMKSFFDTSKPSYNLRGWKGIVERTEQRLGFKTSKIFWKMYRKYEKENKDKIPASLDSTSVQRALGKVRKGNSRLSYGKIEKKLTEELKEEYERRETLEKSSVAGLVRLADEGDEKES